jgi:hypothetical protein
MWAAWVIHDVSAKGKASEHAAAKYGWMNGWKIQKEPTTQGEKPRKVSPKCYTEKR